MNLISVDDYKRTKRIDWNNVHSKRLQELTGDSTLVVGFDSETQKWLIACIRERAVVPEMGSEERLHRENVPVVWAAWDDTPFGGHGQALSILDPRLADYVNACNRAKNPSEIDRSFAMHKLKLKGQIEAGKREMHEKAKEMAPHLAKLVDEKSGYIGRERGGGERKVFYPGCLH